MKESRSQKHFERNNKKPNPNLCIELIGFGTRPRKRQHQLALVFFFLAIAPRASTLSADATCSDKVCLALSAEDARAARRDFCPL